MFSFRPHLEHCEAFLGVAPSKTSDRGTIVTLDNDQISMDLLVARADLYAEAMLWDDLLPLARDLVALQPDDPHGWIHLAQALRELGRIQEARNVLLTAEPQHTECAVVHYNLACYDSLLGNLNEARRRLALACEISPEWQTIALCDPDLRALRAAPAVDEGD